MVEGPLAATCSKTVSRLSPNVQGAARWALCGFAALPIPCSIHLVVWRLLWLPPVKQEVFDPVGLRSSAVFCQAYECGISEATGRYGVLRIRSKSPMRAAMLSHVRAWLEASGIEENYVLRSIFGGRIVEEAVAPYSVSRRLKRLAEKAGLDAQTVRNLSEHSMMVGAAKDMAEEGFDLLALMTAGGWKTAHVVARYTSRRRGSDGLGREGQNKIITALITNYINFDTCGGLGYSLKKVIWRRDQIKEGQKRR